MTFNLLAAISVHVCFVLLHIKYYWHCAYDLQCHVRAMLDITIQFMSKLQLVSGSDFLCIVECTVVVWVY
jgi:hypothetical protein